MKTGLVIFAITFFLAIVSPNKVKAEEDVIAAVRSVSYLGRKDLPRGMRNNNPGNIRINSSNHWLGKVRPTQNTDGAFEQFITYGHGVRAMIKLVRDTYITRDGLDSIELIITKWAPSNENDTTAYINMVSKKMGKNRNAALNTDYQTMKSLLQAIALHENGRSDALTDAMFALGWSMA